MFINKTVINWESYIRQWDQPCHFPKILANERTTTERFNFGGGLIDQTIVWGWGKKHYILRKGAEAHRVLTSNNWFLEYKTTESNCSSTPLKEFQTETLRVTNLINTCINRSTMIHHRPEASSRIHQSRKHNPCIPMVKKASKNSSTTLLREFETQMQKHIKLTYTCICTTAMVWDRPDPCHGLYATPCEILQIKDARKRRLYQFVGVVRVPRNTGRNSLIRQSHRITSKNTGGVYCKTHLDLFFRPSTLMKNTPRPLGVSRLTGDYPNTTRFPSQPRPRWGSQWRLNHLDHTKFFLSGNKRHQ